MKIGILGAGNWGTTMALLLERQGHDVWLWTPYESDAEAMRKSRENKVFLPGYKLPQDIYPTSSLEHSHTGSVALVLALPAQVCREVLKKIRELDENTVIVSLIKGIEQVSLKRISEVCHEELEHFNPKKYCVLSGPTIAPEIAEEMPSSAVVASFSAASASFIQRTFSTPNFRLYTSDDVIGVEIAGAMKNVIALASGICDGMQLGSNTKGALLTRGLAEIARLGEAVGGKKQTFSGLSGIGDLVTTCVSPQSRNRFVGEQIGKGKKLKEILEGMTMVAEGVWTAKAAKDLAKHYTVEMPITDAICQILYEDKSPYAALSELMVRDLKEEN